jgi:hypothetical protein
MTDDDFFELPVVKAATARRQKVMPADDWSHLNQLPAGLAKAAKGARTEDLYAGLRGVRGAIDEGGEARVLSALDRLANIAATDATESMLAELMIVTHSAAMASITQAHDAGLGTPGALAHLAVFKSLTTQFVQQMNALDKRRGRGDQKVTVEHVNVQSGGQAIVGNVRTTSKRANRAKKRGLDDASGTDAES